MSSMIIVMPVGVDPQMRAWLADHGLSVPEGRDRSRYPTWEEIVNAAQELRPAQLDERDERVTRAQRIADVLFASVEVTAGGARYYAGGGFEISADFEGSPLHEEVSSLSFRGGALEHVHALCRRWSERCGPLVAMDGCYGTPALVTPQTSLAQFESALLAKVE